MSASQRRAWFSGAVAQYLGIALVGSALPLHGQDPPRSPALLSREELQEEIIRTADGLEALEQEYEKSPIIHQVRQVEAERDALDEKSSAARAPLDEQLKRLRTSPEFEKFNERWSALYTRRARLIEAQRKFQREEGQRLFARRHRELAEQAAADTKDLSQLGLTVFTYPRMDGSTSTQPLATLIACRCFAVPYQWVGKEQFADQWERMFPAEAENTLLEFTLQAKTEPRETERLGAIINNLLAVNASTHQAYVNLVEGRSDIGLLARGPSVSERELAKAQGVELDVRPCALDAFVVMVNLENEVRNLSAEQVREIYVGKIENWKEVGGADRKITAYQRDKDSGSQQLMRELVMKEVALDRPASSEPSGPQLIGYLMSSPYLQLSNDTTGIGYSVYYYERFMSGSPYTRTIAIDGIQPTPETIASRKYPFVSEVFVVTRKDAPADSPAIKLRDWLLSPEGQAVVRESGYVPLAVGKE